MNPPLFADDKAKPAAKDIPFLRSKPAGVTGSDTPACNDPGETYSSHLPRTSPARSMKARSLGGMKRCLG